MNGKPVLVQSVWEEEIGYHKPDLITAMRTYHIIKRYLGGDDLPASGELEKALGFALIVGDSQVREFVSFILRMRSGGS